MKNFKRIIVGLLIVAMCSQSFAAVVSDNDGSAFITKAEFDSLKNNFQAQIDNYNSSIDSKIDGAIASYLSGIQVMSNFNENSEIYKLNNVTPVKFKSGWTVPVTRIGTHAKMGMQFVAIPNTSIIIPDTNLNQPYWAAVKINGVNYPTYSNGTYTKMGLKFGTYGSWPSDQLRIGEKDGSNNSKKNLLYRVYTTNLNGTEYRYTENVELWDLTPLSFGVAVSVGGLASNFPIPAGLNKDDNKMIKFSVSDTVPPDLANKTFGSADWTWTYKYSNMCATTPDWQDGLMTKETKITCNSKITFDCEAVKSTVDTSENWSICSSGSVPSTAKYYGVLDSDWNLSHDTAHSTCNSWAAYMDVCSYDTPTTKMKGYEISDTNWVVYDGKPTVSAYLKKYSQYNASENIMYNYSIIEQTPIYYYSGIPLLKAINKGRVKVTLNLAKSDNTFKTYIAVNDTPWGNNDLYAGNINLYEDQSTDTYTTTRTVPAGALAATDTFYIDVQPGTTYWIRVKPETSGKTVAVTSDETFEGVTKN